MRLRVLLFLLIAAAGRVSRAAPPVDRPATIPSSVPHMEPQNQTAKQAQGRTTNPLHSRHDLMTTETPVVESATSAISAPTTQQSLEGQVLTVPQSTWNATNLWTLEDIDNAAKSLCKGSWDASLDECTGFWYESWDESFASSEDELMRETNSGKSQAGSYAVIKIVIVFVVILPIKLILCLVIKNARKRRAVTNAQESSVASTTQV